MLCQHPPFHVASFSNQAILTGQFSQSPRWLSLSNNAKDLISKMLTVNPEERFTIDQILAHPWFF